MACCACAFDRCLGGVRARTEVLWLALGCCGAYIVDAEWACITCGWKRRSTRGVEIVVMGSKLWARQDLRSSILVSPADYCPWALQDVPHSRGLGSLYCTVAACDEIGGPFTYMEDGRWQQGFCRRVAEERRRALLPWAVVCGACVVDCD